VRVYAPAGDRTDPLAAAIALGGVLLALLVGIGLAISPPLGVGTLVAALYLPLVFVNVPLAVALWIPLVFLDAIPAFNLAGKAAGLLLVVGWIGVLLSGGAARSVFSRHRHLLEALLALVVWLTLSLAWAPNTAQAAEAAWQWLAVALVFVIVATSISSQRTLVLAMTMYVAGALLAVAIGMATGGLSGGEDGRLEGPIGDANFFAAALVSAIPIAFALSTVRSGLRWRWFCLGSVAVLALGVVSSQSRGGLAAAVGMWLAAVVVLPRKRQVVALGAVVLAAAAVAFSFNPASWDRVREAETNGTGRVDLWTVAWSMFEDHPVRGVGVGNFGRVAPDYVREVGPLEDVQLVVKTPDREVHNSFLELLAENGVVGLVLFLAVGAGCLRAALRAARIFGELGRGDLVAVAHGVFAGTVGLLASYFFISGSVDRRLWILLGLCLALLEIANRETAGRGAVLSARSASA
jgi:O-antigen ligase